jgi:hypothetical protein
MTRSTRWEWRKIGEVNLQAGKQKSPKTEDAGAKVSDIQGRLGIRDSLPRAATWLRCAAPRIHTLRLSRICSGFSSFD